MPQFLEITPPGSSLKRKMTVCGYPLSTLKQHKHSNKLLIDEHIGHYDIDTEKGQSGSPIYFLKRELNSVHCFVVGIHKGSDDSFLQSLTQSNNDIEHNIGVLITKRVVEQIDQWKTIILSRTKE